MLMVPLTSHHDALTSPSIARMLSPEYCPELCRHSATPSPSLPAGTENFPDFEELEPDKIHLKI